MVGCVISGTMILVVVAAKWNNMNDMDATRKSEMTLNALLALVLFVGIWFQCFVFACSKYIIGYVVGVWYFTT